MSKHTGCDDLRTCCTEVEVYVGQGLQTGHTEYDLPHYACTYTESKLKRGPNILIRHNLSINFYLGETRRAGI